MDKAALDALLKSLTSEQKRELAELGISAARRSDWLHGNRKPTAAQLRTLAIVVDEDPIPMLLWLAQEEATPAQLDLFQRALATATAGIFAVILSGAAHDANAASMRVAALSDQPSVTHIMLSSWRRLTRLAHMLSVPPRAAESEQYR